MNYKVITIASWATFAAFVLGSINKVTGYIESIENKHYAEVTAVTEELNNVRKDLDYYKSCSENYRDMLEEKTEMLAIAKENETTIVDEYEKALDALRNLVREEKTQYEEQGLAVPDTIASMHSILSDE